eukprot:CAMPEP_0202970180 /NCGR_PEP_ID=MMETSP1396-20130829/16168_1 /ASSEMBLY_ACC=CAM_ASM_000872 /TAXON_ID= /ORGANISM="Pseudokeronopsis sp., Strain Brazil" /LENGTH=100 /DNA_ID=CAMNT_0049698535 /DNA_START=455 /DNA_END=757 /DNA_ORIENTATION=+
MQLLFFKQERRKLNSSIDQRQALIDMYELRIETKGMEEDPYNMETLLNSMQVSDSVIVRSVITFQERRQAKKTHFMIMQKVPGDYVFVVSRQPSSIVEAC